MNTDIPKKRVFSDKLVNLIGFGIFLTGIASISGLLSIISSIKNQSWNNTGLYSFSWSVILFLSIVINFIGLVKIALNEIFFSKTLCYCIWLIGSVFCISSFVLPRLDGYKDSGFTFLSSEDFVLIDASILLPGIILIILGCIVREGFQLQKESENIL